MSVHENRRRSLEKTAKTSLPRTGSKKWTRVRQAYQAGELDAQSVGFVPDLRHRRRNALADTSAVSTSAHVTCEKHRFHQLAERVRELQQEIAPDFLLYQVPPTYSPFSGVTPSSNVAGSGPGFSNYAPRNSLSVSSGSPNSSVPTQWQGLSSKVIQHAHQIPERFWIEWQQKQMQDRIDELEYIKNNLGCSPASSFEETGADTPLERRPSYEEIRRQSVIFLHRAQQLANERRSSLARSNTFDGTVPATIEENSQTTSVASPSPIDDKTEQFSFDQRSDADEDAANLDDFDDSRLEPPKTLLDRSCLTISLPFTYTNTRESTLLSGVCCQSQPAKDSSSLIVTPATSIEDVAKIDTELNVTLLSRQNQEQTVPLLYSKATINRRVEFRKLRAICELSGRKTKSLVRIPITYASDEDTLILVNTDTENHRRMISSILPFESTLSPILQNSDENRSVSFSTTTTLDHEHHHQQQQQLQSDECISPMMNVYELEQHHRISSSSSSTSSFITPSDNEEGDDMSVSRTLFTCRNQRQCKKGVRYIQKAKAPVSSITQQSNLALPYDNVKENSESKSRKSPRTSCFGFGNRPIISSEKTRQWQQNADSFQRDLLAGNNDNDDDGDDDVILSSSSSAAPAVCSIRRQCKKQTRLKGKTASRRKKKKKKRERNKKSASSTTAVAAKALFHSFALDASTLHVGTISYPHEQASRADRRRREERNCFSIQTSTKQLHRQQQQNQSKFILIMADRQSGSGILPTATSAARRKIKKKKIRVFVRRRRAPSIRKRAFMSSPESLHSRSTDFQELASFIQRKKSSRFSKDLLVINYKPVFINSRQRRPKTRTVPEPPPQPRASRPPPPIPTDDDLSSVTNNSRRRSLTTTTSSDGSPFRSKPAHRHYHHQQQQQQPNNPSVSFDLPDVEDPLMFIEMMYQQIFTEDGQVRSGTEPSAFANCVKQLVTSSRRNSLSHRDSLSSIATGSSSTHYNKQMATTTTPSYRKLSCSSSQRLLPPTTISVSSSPRMYPSEHYDTFSEEDEDAAGEEPATLVPASSQSLITKKTNSSSRRNSKRFSTDTNIDPVSHQKQMEAFLDSYRPARTSTNNNCSHRSPSGFRFSIDDTDNEDLDTFSDLNSCRVNNKTIGGISPSVDDDFTHTDSRLLSSSGYQSLDRSRKSFSKGTPIDTRHHRIITKSNSDSDLLPSLSKGNQQVVNCPACMRPPRVTVIPPLSSSTSVAKRICQPIGEVLMKYLNFVLISKNVLLVPLIIFLVRQRSSCV